LVKEKTEILFVVPKAYGDEDITLINASEIWIDAGSEEEKAEEAKPLHTATTTEIVTIHVPSALSPYRSTSERTTIQRWNWEHRIDVATDGAFPIERKRFGFSGGYGPNLLEEVKRYADVAAAITTAYDFDLIHAHDWLTYPAGMTAKKISGKKLVVHVHATEYDRGGEGNIDKQVFDIERNGMINADAIIAVSQWTKDIVVNKYGIDEAKVHVVHNGVSTDEPLDFSFLPKISDHVITFLGRMTAQKGPEYFIEAARRVLELFPDAHFIMAGSGDLLPAMIERVAQLRLSSRIHFTGFLKGRQVHTLWSVTDLYVMPSVSEPFGITPLEAILSNVPVIVSNQSGVSEVIEHAIKVDFWDTESLASAIVNVLKHQGLADSLRENSRSEVESLTWKRAAKEINTIYHEISSN
jgi:glycosyltransferase involved in cell wall biosynthesis